MSGNYIPLSPETTRQGPKSLPPHGLAEISNLMNESVRSLSVSGLMTIWRNWLEREASLMPPGCEASVYRVLLQQARFFRESTRTETITIPKQIADKSGFIFPTGRMDDLCEDLPDRGSRS